MYNIDINRFVRRLLPPFLRTALQRAYIEVLLKPVSVLLADLNAFQDEKRLEMAFTSQTLSLEAWLNYKLDPLQKRIKIIHTVPIGDYDYLVSEGQAPDYDYLVSEGVDNGFIYFEGENGTGFSEGFRVFAPAELLAREAEIRANVQKFKFAFITYSIAYSN